MTFLKVYDRILLAIISVGKGEKMAKSEIRDFTTGNNIMRQLITFASPLFLSNLLQIIYNMVDMMVVGAAEGKAGISAVSVGGDITALLTFVSMGFAGAGQVIIARYIGMKKHEELGRFVGTMTGFMLLCAAVLSVLGVVLRNELLLMMNTPDDAWQGALNYSMVCASGLVFIYGYNIVSAILRGMGDSKHPFIFIAIAAGINVVIDLVFVFGFKMGAMGAAFATVISQAISFIISAIFLLRHKERFSLKIILADFYKWDKGMLGELVRLGVPMAIKTASIQASKLFVNAWVNGYGIAISAFSGIVNKIASIANLISAAMNTAGSTMVGQNLAAKKYDRVNKILLDLAIVTLSVAALLSLVMVLFPNAIYGLFTNDPEVLLIGEGFIYIAVILFFSGALRAVMNALLNGSGNYKINFVTAIFDGIIMRIGLTLLLGVVLGMEHYGFWLGDALAGFTPFLVGVGFYFFGNWKKDANEVN